MADLTQGDCPIIIRREGLLAPFPTIPPQQTFLPEVPMPVYQHIESKRDVRHAVSHNT